MTVVVAWDFHGVLEKGNDLAVQAICQAVLLERDISTPVDIALIRQLYGLRWVDYFSTLLPAASTEDHWTCVARAQVISSQITDQFLQPNDFASDVLSFLQEQGAHQLIVSNSHPDRITSFVHHVGLTGYFSHIVGIDKHNKVSPFDIIAAKAAEVKTFAAQRDATKIFFIGDREEDVLAGCACNATTILYRGPLSGHPGPTVADHTVVDLREILALISPFLDTF